MSIQNFIAESAGLYLAEVVDVLGKLPADPLHKVVARLDEARWKGQAVYTCGNGGSAATAIHFASDLAKGAQAPNKPPFKALSLCENISLVTAWANDVSYNAVFAQRMAPWLRSGDVLIAVSGSGNSKNVLNAVFMAKANGATTIGLAGFDGGRLQRAADICITVPCNCMEQVEDVHMLLCHFITTCLRNLPLPTAASYERDAVGQAR